MDDTTRKNLEKGKPHQFKSGAQAAAAGSKGGKVSQRNRKRKKDLQELTVYMLSLGLSEGKVKEQIRAMGLDDNDLTNAAAVTAAMLMKAVAGDVQAAAYLRDTSGANPSQKIRKEELALRESEFEHKKEVDAKNGGADMADVFDRLDEVLKGIGGEDGVQ